MQCLFFFFTPILSSSSLVLFTKKGTHKLLFFYSCIIGRRKPASIRSKGEGVYIAEFTPQAEGPHRIDINWSDQPIRQRYILFFRILSKIKRVLIFVFFSSPFNVQVLPHFEPHKVIVDGPGIRNGIPASLETYFSIDTRNAGFEQPEVTIKVNTDKKKQKHIFIIFSLICFFLKNPEGLLVSSKIVDNKDETYKITYRPNDVGRYLINVNYGGIPVNNSPFNVKVEPVGDASKCHISGKYFYNYVHLYI